MSKADPRIIAGLYKAVADNGRLHGAIEALARGLECDTATIVIVDPTECHATAKLGVGAFDPASCARYNADYAALNPAPAAMAPLPSGAVVASDAYFSAEFRRKSAFVQEFMEPIGVAESLVGKVSGERGRLTMLSVHRGKTRRAFDEGDADTLAAYLPFIDQALALRRIFIRLQTGFSALSGAIDRLSLAIAVYGCDGLIHVNTAMLGLVARTDGLEIDASGALRADNADANATLARLNHAVLAGDAGSRISIPRGPGRLPLIIMIAPLPAPAFGLSQRCAIILAHDPECATEANPAAIARACGLPAGAARLVAAMLQGESAVEYGRRVGLSHATVRHHLNVAFDRTGARSQAHLLVRVTHALAEKSLLETAHDIHPSQSVRKQTL